MKILDMKLGYSCDNACIHCVSEEMARFCARENIPVDQGLAECKKKLRQAAECGCEAIMFTGGEPSLMRDFPDILFYAKTLGLAVKIQTNARAFADREFVEKIARIADIDYLISLHGPSADIHDAVTRRSGSFDDSVRGVKNLLELNQKLGCKLIINKLNYKYLPESAEFFYEIGFEGVCLTFPAGLGHAQTHFYDVVPKYSEISHYVLKTLQKYGGREIYTETIPFCFLAGYEKYDVEMHAHNRNRFQLSQYGTSDGFIDTEQLFKELKTRLPVCGACLFENLCRGVYRDYPAHYGTNEFKPVTEKTDDIKQILDAASSSRNEARADTAPSFHKGIKIAEFAIGRDININDININFDNGKLSVWLVKK